MSEEAVAASGESVDERYEPEAMEANATDAVQADVNLELVLDVQVLRTARSLS